VTDVQTELRWLRRATAVAAVARKNEEQLLTIKLINKDYSNNMTVD